MQKFLVRSLFLVLLLSAAESWALPKCKKPFWGTIKYHNCQGTITFADGGKYVGEWKDGKWHGQGNLTYADGRNYVGEWKYGNVYVEGIRAYAGGRV